VKPFRAVVSILTFLCNCRRSGSSRTRLSNWIAAACCAVAAPLGGGCRAERMQPAPQPFAVYYARTAPTEQLQRYNLLVLDNENHGPLRPLLTPARTVLGYLSVGEVGNHRSYFSAAREEGLLLMENENWKGSFMVDLRLSGWRKRVVDELVPSILAQGFDGLFLDTLDNAGHLERVDPVRFAGMKTAAVALVRELRERFPDAVIMLNRGYDLLDEAAPHIDAVLGESVYASYDFAAKEYRLVPEPLYRQQLEILTGAKRRAPHLAVYTLDYWNPEDRVGRRKIYEVQRSNGFVPYVATIELDRLIEE
jgi:polysaccharide biosynthesis protein PelA